MSAILIVDDEKSMRDIISTVLLKVGFNTILAEDVETALHLLEVNPNIECVVCDVNLNVGGDGLDLAQKIRDMYPQIRIIIISGEGKTDRLAHIGAEVCDEILLKPFSYTEFMDVIKKRPTTPTMMSRAA